jgi:hypothetical protein
VLSKTARVRKLESNTLGMKRKGRRTRTRTHIKDGKPEIM